MANTLGSRISEHRRKKGLTQDQLADYMGVSSQAVSKWENDLSCPDISLLPTLSEVFNITIDELLRGDNNNTVQYLSENERKSFDKMLLKMRVKSAEGDIVKINIPLVLIKTGIEIGMQLPQFSGNNYLKDIDLSSVILAAESGVIGKIMEVNSKDGDVVEIFIS